MAAHPIQVGDTVAHWAAPRTVMGEIESLSVYKDQQVAVITWTQDGEKRRMTVPLEQLVPLCVRDRCDLIPDHR